MGDATQPGGQADDLMYDLARIVRDNGWAESRIVALRNTCAAAATKATLPAHERDLAAAIAAALVDPSAAISAAHMDKLVEWELLGPSDHSRAS